MQSSFRLTDGLLGRGFHVVEEDAVHNQRGDLIHINRTGDLHILQGDVSDIRDMEDIIRIIFDGEACILAADQGHIECALYFGVLINGQEFTADRETFFQVESGVDQVQGNVAEQDIGAVIVGIVFIHIQISVRQTFPYFADGVVAVHAAVRQFGPGKEGIVLCRTGSVCGGTLDPAAVQIHFVADFDGFFRHDFLHDPFRPGGSGIGSTAVVLTQTVPVGIAVGGIPERVGVETAVALIAGDAQIFVVQDAVQLCIQINTQVQFPDLEQISGIQHIHAVHIHFVQVKEIFRREQRIVVNVVHTQHAGIRDPPAFRIEEAGQLADHVVGTGDRTDETGRFTVVSTGAAGIVFGSRHVIRHADPAAFTGGVVHHQVVQHEEVSAVSCGCLGKVPAVVLGISGGRGTGNTHINTAAAPEVCGTLVAVIVLHIEAVGAVHAVTHQRTVDQPHTALVDGGTGHGQTAAGSTGFVVHEGEVFHTDVGTPTVTGTGGVRCFVVGTGDHTAAGIFCVVGIECGIFDHHVHLRRGILVLVNSEEETAAVCGFVAFKVAAVHVQEVGHEQSAAALDPGSISDELRINDLDHRRDTAAVVRPVMGTLKNGTAGEGCFVVDKGGAGDGDGAGSTGGTADIDSTAVSVDSAALEQGIFDLNINRAVFINQLVACPAIICSKGTGAVNNVKGAAAGLSVSDTAAVAGVGGGVVDELGIPDDEGGIAFPDQLVSAVAVLNVCTMQRTAFRVNDRSGRVAGVNVDEVGVFDEDILDAAQVECAAGSTHAAHNIHVPDRQVKVMELSKVDTAGTVMQDRTVKVAVGPAAGMTAHEFQAVGDRAVFCSYAAVDGQVTVAVDHDQGISGSIGMDIAVKIAASVIVVVCVTGGQTGVFTAGNEGDIEVVAESTGCKITPVIGVIPHTSHTAEVGGGADTDHGIDQSDFRQFSGVVITDLHGEVHGILNGNEEAVIFSVVIAVPQVNVCHTGVVLISASRVEPVRDLHAVVIVIHGVDFGFTAVAASIRIDGVEPGQIIQSGEDHVTIGNVEVVSTERAGVESDRDSPFFAVIHRSECQDEFIRAFPDQFIFSGITQDRSGGVIGTALGLVQFHDPQRRAVDQDTAGLIGAGNIGKTVSHHLECGIDRAAVFTEGDTGVVIIFCNDMFFAVEIFKDLRLDHVALLFKIPVQNIEHGLEVARHIVAAHEVIAGTVLDEQVVHQVESAAVDHMDHTAAIVSLVHHHGGIGHIDFAGIAVDGRAFQCRIVEERIVREERVGILHIQRTALGSIVPEAVVIELGGFIAFPDDLVHFQRVEIFRIERTAGFRFVHAEVGDFDLHIQLVRFLREEVRRTAQFGGIALEVHFVHGHFRALGVGVGGIGIRYRFFRFNHIGTGQEGIASESDHAFDIIADRRHNHTILTCTQITVRIITPIFKCGDVAERHIHDPEGIIQRAGILRVIPQRIEDEHLCGGVIDIITLIVLIRLIFIDRVADPEIRNITIAVSTTADSLNIDAIIVFDSFDQSFEGIVKSLILCIVVIQTAEAFGQLQFGIGLIVSVSPVTEFAGSVIIDHEVVGGTVLIRIHRDVVDCDPAAGGSYSGIDNTDGAAVAGCAVAAEHGIGQGHFAAVQVCIDRTAFCAAVVLEERTFHGDGCPVLAVRQDHRAVLTALEVVEEAVRNGHSTLLEVEELGPALEGAVRDRQCGAAEDHHSAGGVNIGHGQVVQVHSAQCLIEVKEDLCGAVLDRALAERHSAFAVVPEEGAVIGMDILHVQVLHFHGGGVVDHDAVAGNDQIFVVVDIICHAVKFLDQQCGFAVHGDAVHIHIHGAVDGHEVGDFRAGDHNIFHIQELTAGKFQQGAAFQIEGAFFQRGSAAGGQRDVERCAGDVVEDGIIHREVTDLRTGKDTFRSIHGHIVEVDIHAAGSAGGIDQGAGGGEVQMGKTEGHIARHVEHGTGGSSEAGVVADTGDIHIAVHRHGGVEVIHLIRHVHIHVVGFGVINGILNLRDLIILSNIPVHERLINFQIT